MTTRLGSLLLAITVITAACTSSSSPEPSARELSGGETLPGVQAFGLTDAEFAKNVETTEKLISSCMAEAGFEYVPVDVTAFLAVEDWLRADPAMTRQEFKERWGYGISTRSDFPARDVGLGPQNLRIYDELAPADQVAYDRTLFGEDTDATFAITIDDEDFTSTGGCTKIAIDEVFPEQMKTGTFVNPKDILVESDPRVVASLQEWSDCMAEDDYEYVDQDEIIEEYEEQFDILTEGEDPEDLTGPRLEALQELQVSEIAVALKDLECQAPVDEAVRIVEIEIFGAPVSG